MIKTMDVIDYPKVWKSYVWYESKCFIVSTIYRYYDIPDKPIGMETLVWEFNWNNSQRGKMLWEGGGIEDHQAICRCIIAEGVMLDDDNPAHEKFRKP